MLKPVSTGITTESLFSVSVYLKATCHPAIWKEVGMPKMATLRMLSRRLAKATMAMMRSSPLC